MQDLLKTMLLLSALAAMLYRHARRSNVRPNVEWATLDVSGLPSGVCLVRVTTARFTLVR